MDFSSALRALQDGKKVRRSYFAPGAFLMCTPGSTFTIEADRPLGRALPDKVGQQVDFEPHIDFYSPIGAVFIWSVPHYDLFADDWEIV